MRRAIDANCEVIAKLEGIAGSELKRDEKQSLRRLRSIQTDGVEAVLRRYRANRSMVERELTAFVAKGPRAILAASGQRAGDFLNSQMRGQWAEDVVLSLLGDRLIAHRFGPSEAKMPNEPDYLDAVQAMREIALIEGKRPDIIAFEMASWERLTPEEQSQVGEWQQRSLRDADLPVLRRALCAIEVKNSRWHFASRRRVSAAPLSITLKDEELIPLKRWRRRARLPIVLFQVFFDEVYCMSFTRMRIARKLERIYFDGDFRREKDRKTGKNTSFFNVDNRTEFVHRGARHLCGSVRFPDNSEAKVPILPSGEVEPHLILRPASAFDFDLDVVLREARF